jgi:uridylate kinase
MAETLKYKRVLLKLSGESLGGGSLGYDLKAIKDIASDIKEVHEAGVEVAIVVGGGNLCRGSALAELGVERVSADYMGMLATVMNALALQSVLEQIGIVTRVQSAIPMTTVCEPYIRRKAIRHMEKGRVVILAAGTGSPYVTTDTNAALRAIETGSEVVLKATQVDGIYSMDPKKDSSAQRYEKISYTDVLLKDLKIMDAAAISLARENKIPILVFSVHNRGEMLRVLQGQGNYTIVE